jgi:IS5 family transposase
MLRLYFAQQCFGLSDETLEDAVSDSAAIRNFIGCDLELEEAPDATSVLFEQINVDVRERGPMMREGTMVTATLTDPPTSTKNRDRARNPEMHQPKRRIQRYPDMKAYVGANAESGSVHRTRYAVADESKAARTHEVLHEQEDDVFLDVVYSGVHKREKILKA